MLMPIPFFKETGGGFQLQPFAFITECVDDKYRIAMVFQVQGSGWTGRYMYHLPTAYNVAEFKSPSPQLLAGLTNVRVIPFALSGHTGPSPAAGGSQRYSEFIIVLA